MKTWTNPTVEELEVKATAYFNIEEYAEYNHNWEIEPDLILGDPNAGENSGNTGNTGNEGNQGSDEGSDEGFGTES